MLGDADKALAAQLYFALVMPVKGQPPDIAQNAGQGEGAEAFNKLTRRLQARALRSLAPGSPMTWKQRRSSASMKQSEARAWMMKFSLEW